MLISIGERIGHWFQGQLIIGLILGILSYIVYVALGVPDALFLALIAGVASFVPIVGAAIAIVPAVFLALTISVVKAIVVLVFAIVVHQVIASALVPRIMARAVGLNPVVIVIVMLLGSVLAGGLGLIMAVPIASILDVVVQEYGRGFSRKGGVP
jgi:predicted PurR-regulated permease PerM